MRSTRTIYWATFVAFVILCAEQVSFGLPITDSLLAHYPLDGNAEDVVGPHDGSTHNVSLTNGRNGDPDAAYEFLGSTSSYIHMGHANIIQDNTYTISLWAMVDASNNDINVLIHKRRGSHGSNFYSWNLRLYPDADDNDGVYDQINGQVNDQNLVTSGPGINMGQWNHIAMTSDGSTRTIYLNGIARASDSSGSLIPTQTQSFPNEMGRWSGQQFAFKGLLDDVAIYDRALSAAEIQIMFQDDVNPIPAPLAVIPGAIALAWISRGRKFAV